MESPAVGSQRRGQSLSVPAVVLGARSREAVAKAVELLGIDGVNIEPAIKKRLDDGAVRNLDRNMHIFRAAAACGDKPIAHLRKPFAAVLEGSFAKAFAAGIGKPDIVLLGCPIDAGKPALCFLHLIFPAVISSLRDICRSLYWRSKAHSSHWASYRGHPPGHVSEAGALRKSGAQGQLGRSRRAARFGKAAPIRSRRLCFVPLRFTSHSLRGCCLQNRLRTVQGHGLPSDFYQMTAAA